MKRRRRNQHISADTLYYHWLYKGRSLRQIGRLYGISRTTVQEYIRQKYGRNATNPRMNSLARVMAEEYGYPPLVEKARNIPGLYHSRRQEDNIAIYQSLEFFDRIPYEPQEPPEEPLRLPLFIWFTDRLVEVLYMTITNYATDRPQAEG